MKGGDHLEHYTNYLRTAFEADPADVAKKARAALRGVKYDTMVGIGLSGALVVPALARALHKHWLIVRKTNEHSHSSSPAEGRLGTRWVFVDDFISTGSSRELTRTRITEYIAHCVEWYNGAKNFKTVEVGTYSYSEGKYSKVSNDKMYGY